MSQNKKPRKAYRPRPVTAHTMGLASQLAAKPLARSSVTFARKSMEVQS